MVDVRRASVGLAVIAAAVALAIACAPIGGGTARQPGLVPNEILGRYFMLEVLMETTPFYEKQPCIIVEVQRDARRPCFNATLEGTSVAASCYLHNGGRNWTSTTADVHAEFKFLTVLDANGEFLTVRTPSAVVVLGRELRLDQEEINRLPGLSEVVDTFINKTLIDFDHCTFVLEKEAKQKRLENFS